MAGNGDVTAYVGGLYEVTYSSGGALKNTKLYYAFGAQVVAMRDNGTLYYLHGDNLGSASLTTNTSGGVVSQNKYYPFGASRLTQGTRPTDLDFTGQRLDGTGLHFYNARYYDSLLGRFVQADTVVPDWTNSQNLNRFLYARNNPLKYTDPTGHCEIVCFVVATALAVTLLLTSPDWGPQVSRRPIENNLVGIGCIESLATCYQQGKLSDFQDNQIEAEEFNEFLETVAKELEAGWTEPVNNPENILSYGSGVAAGRDRYDTPFYNGGGQDAFGREADNPPYSADQQVCIGDLGCWGRSEVNYIAQGMWGAASGENLEQTLGVVKFWNKDKYGLSPSDIEGKLYWTEYGYNWYKNWDEERVK